MIRSSLLKFGCSFAQPIVYGHSIAANIRRRPLKVLFPFTFILLFYILTSTLETSGLRLQRPFHEVRLSGFQNTGSAIDKGCNVMGLERNISIQESLHIKDDLLGIAYSLKHHPIVDFHYNQHILQHPNTSFEEYAAHPGKWGRLAGSSVWLEEQRVYLMVTRIIFYLNGENNHPPMSFMRGQIFDSDWTHLEKYALHWQDNILIFPLIFDVDCPFTTDNGLFGPEDPRIIIEHDLPGAEPVIVFSMIMNVTTRRRAMALFRPFSNVTTVLTIEGREQKQTEKNWAPFFRINGSHEHRSDDGLQTQNPFLHFVYDMEPLQILKCNIARGNCTVVFEQDVEHDVSDVHKQRASWGFMRGGTNFELVHSHHAFGDTDESTIHTYLGIPRTHLNNVCYRAMYRPEIMLLSSNSSHFWIAYTSGPFDMLEESAMRDPCGQGRIIIVNSIARIGKENGFIGRRGGGEVTVSMSVGDSTVQVAKMGNVLALMRDVLSRKIEEHGLLISGRDTLLCSVALASDYGVRVTSPVLGKPKFLDP